MFSKGGGGSNDARHFGGTVVGDGAVERDKKMKPSVVVTLPLPGAVLDSLSASFDLQAWSEPESIPDAVLSEWTGEADAILCSLGTAITAELLASSPKLRVISSISVGVDHIDLAAATDAGLPVGHTPEVLVDSTADMAVALMLAVMRRMVEADRFVREGRWGTGWSTDFFLGSDLSRATVGIVGLGPIGRAVATRVQSFGAKVIGWNRSERNVSGVQRVELDALFEEADVVSIHTAATPDTRHLVSASRIDRMKQGAVLINTARGAIVDEVALVAALTAGRIRAGLDVYAREPLPHDHPLLRLDNVVLVPHLGSATAATREAMLERALINLTAGLRGDRLPWCANPEVYPDS